MKKTLHSLIGMAVIIPIFLISCSKSTEDIKPVVKPPDPLPPAAPYINLSSNPTRPFMNGGITFEASSNGKLTSSTGVDATKPIMYTNVTTPISFRLTAVITDAVTGLSSSKTLDVSSQPYSTDTTYRCANATLDGYAVWTNTSTIQSTNGGITWTPGPIDPSQWSYYPDGKRKTVTGFSSEYYISVSGGVTYINLSESYNPPNIYKQESLTATTMVLSKTDNSGTMFKITFTK